MQRHYCRMFWVARASSKWMPIVRRIPGEGKAYEEIAQPCFAQTNEDYSHYTLANDRDGDISDQLYRACGVAVYCD
jgi:hypothetical protein